MATEQTYMALFDDEQAAAKAVTELENTSWSLKRVHSPIPSHVIADALKVKKSPVGWFTLVGGIIGFFAGFLLAAFTATRWDMIVSGKPVVALVPFFIVGFEFTVLFAVFGNVIGLITQMKLPTYGSLAEHDPDCTGSHFGIVASCPSGQELDLVNFFQDRGARVRDIQPASEQSE